MVYTNYGGMQFGAFKVIEYELNLDEELISFSVRCGSCGELKKIKLKHEKILRIKCRKCGRMDVVIPIKDIKNTKIVGDTITLGAYRYRKLRDQYKEVGSKKSELNYIRDEVYLRDD